MKDSSYIFFLNLREVTTDMPVEIVPNYTLQKATTKQIVKIKEILFPFISQHVNHGKALPYEIDRHYPEGLDGGYTPIPLEEKHWNYYLVKCNEDELGQAFYDAITLSSQELICAFTAYQDFQGYGCDPSILHHTFSEVDLRWNQLSVSIDQEYLLKIRSLHKKLQNHDNTILNLKDYISQFRRLGGIDHGSLLRFLGYFSIIESLLSHAPKPTDPYDSITRQVLTKFSLLNNRFIQQIDYEGFFGREINPETIWKKLYNFRSQIAHGSHADFRSDLQILKSKANAIGFIIHVVKRLLVHGLDEPSLIRDIKNC
jgi:hypothetical protein